MSTISLFGQVLSLESFATSLILAMAFTFGMNIIRGGTSIIEFRQRIEDCKHQCNNNEYTRNQDNGVVTTGGGDYGDFCASEKCPENGSLIIGSNGESAGCDGSISEDVFK